MAGAGVIAVMDLEFTAWEGSSARGWSGPGEEIEVVQIGAVKLRDDGALTEFDVLDILVIPKTNPDLSDYFTNLTGITQAQLDSHGVGYAEALDRLEAFIGNDTQAVYSWGEDYRVLQGNCGLDGLAFPFDEHLFVNARETVKSLFKGKQDRIDSSDLPKALGFQAPGTAHQGLGDCRCIAETLRIARRKGFF